MKSIIKGILLGATITLLLFSLYFGFQYEKSKYLNQGYQTGISDVAYSISKTGNIPLAIQNGNASNYTVSIKTYTLDQLCQQIKQKRENAGDN